MAKTKDTGRGESKRKGSYNLQSNSGTGCGRHEKQSLSAENIYPYLGNRDDTDVTMCRDFCAQERKKKDDAFYRNYGYYIKKRIVRLFTITFKILFVNFFIVENRLLERSKSSCLPKRSVVLISYTNKPVETTLETHYLHGYTYIVMENFIRREIHRVGRSVIYFQHTHIPNHIKFTKLPSREMFEVFVERPGSYAINQLFGNYRDRKTSKEYIIHFPSTTAVNLPGLVTPIKLQP